MVVISNSMCVLAGMVVLLQTGFRKCSIQATKRTGAGKNGRTDLFSSAHFRKLGTSMSSVTHSFVKHQLLEKADGFRFQSCRIRGAGGFRPLDN